MWAYESVFYQIYPLGFCGAPFENDGVQEHRILKVIDWIDHIKKTGCNAIYFSPVFESDTHGYNTRDYSKIDCRLGTNEDFKKVCDALRYSESMSHPDLSVIEAKITVKADELAATFDDAEKMKETQMRL